MIINFHGLGTMPDHVDAGEANVWCADPALYADLLDETREEAAAQQLEPLITFDDGNLSDIEIGLGPVTERGMRAIFFPCAGRIGQRGYLDGSALREVVSAGAEVGSHGWSHTDWRRASPEVMRQEVVEAKDRIEQAAGAPVTTVAIPFGSYGRRVLKDAAVFRTVYTSDAALADADAWLQPRFSYVRSWSRGSVRRVLADSRRPARRLRQNLAMTFKRLR
ncbi:polysaccharide deacetylase family protein [Sphingomonas sp. ID1715]|uniref:polysaccharide deacetylase family protein n=1 Tax=Sphingomonas sp. ID1715 TaxID=1656898 RepID=UPI0034A0A3DD